ncbi:MAG TPA: NAD(P)H-dependent glycerol-3-phosphate dehydrogenase [Blastocatellia bacterium]|nr:NAD(P)H-dependent glycerol-3-phosphate dehydrogenase [Blastocatellia bacterium]
MTDSDSSIHNPRVPIRNREVAIIGAGSWGTALALVAARAGNRVRLWAHSPEVATMLRRERQNKIYLPGFVLPDSIEPTGALTEAMAGAEIVITVTPSHVCREIYAQMLDHARPRMIFVNASKGIEVETGMRMEEVVSDVLKDRFGPRYVTLSGPSFALEVAKDEPCAIVAASHSSEWAKIAQESLSTSRFRVYTNNDVIGVEIGGAIKNVMAIATGAVNGLGLGYNTAAALVTRGLAEMTRLAVRLGGRAETLAGLAGMGDLVLTCFGALSRNRRVGYELGRGRRLQEVIGEMREVAEGVNTARSASELAAQLGVEMPITKGVYQMLYEGKTPQTLEIELMERPLKNE